MSKIKFGFTIAVFALVVALLIPALITATQTDATQTVSLDVGERYDLTDRLSIASDSVSVNQTNATIRMRNEETLEANRSVIDEGSTDTIPVSGENTSVTVENISSENVSTVSVQYSETFGYDDGSRTIIEQMDLLIGLAGFIMIVGLVVAALKV